MDLLLCQGAQWVYSPDPQTPSGCNEYVRAESMKAVIRSFSEKVDSIKSLV